MLFNIVLQMARFSEKEFIENKWVFWFASRICL
jgi:hypothetical protein